MKTQILLLLTLAVASATWAQSAAPAPQASPPSATATLQTVVIEVKDTSGAPVPGAPVRLAPVPDPMPETMQTDNKGQLILQVQSGRYSMVISMPGFSMNKAQFDVAPGNRPQTVPVTLQIAPTGSGFVQPAPDPNVIVLTVAPFNDKFLISKEVLDGLPKKSVVLHNPHSNADEEYQGVLLADLLTKYGAPLGKELRGAFLSCYVLAVGADGYSAVYSLAELDPSFHPGDVIIADSMDGKPLDAHTGPFRLVSTEDKRPARGVRNLVAIELKAAQ
ncbi:MAG TPA: carboxypeptidase regulatory-like domain-containing protein [Verrucomicrobiae bacterium]|nr:carboxypeptidase regulatory-like domain-containing protein [Verrucomicrobiae bacterium]